MNIDIIFAVGFCLIMLPIALESVLKLIDRFEEMRD